MVFKVQLVIKRIFDVLVSFVGLILLSTVLLLIALAIKLDSPGSPFFIQERVGKDGKIFKIFKFRTMLPKDKSIDATGNEIENYARITKVGRFLRKTSLDELPQLFNVLIGNMSLIGPRPTLLYQVEKYTPEQRERLRMLPGISGWAQVNGRNNLSWEEKIEYDRYYVKHFSLTLDIKILIKTIGVVFGQKGVEFTQNDRISKESK